MVYHDPASLTKMHIESQRNKAHIAFFFLWGGVLKCKLPCPTSIVTFLPPPPPLLFWGQKKCNLQFFTPPPPLIVSYHFSAPPPKPRLRGWGSNNNFHKVYEESEDLGVQIPNHLGHSWPADSSWPLGRSCCSIWHSYAPRCYCTRCPFLRRGELWLHFQ